MLIAAMFFESGNANIVNASIVLITNVLEVEVRNYGWTSVTKGFCRGTLKRGRGGKGGPALILRLAPFSQTNISLAEPNDDLALDYGRDGPGRRNGSYRAKVTRPEVLHDSSSLHQYLGLAAHHFLDQLS